MNLIFENSKWIVEINGEKITFEKYLADLLNQDLETPKYALATTEKPNHFVAVSPVKDPQYPGGGMNSSFEITVSASGLLYFSKISDQELFNKLVALLKAKNAIIASQSVSRETIEKLYSHFSKL